MSSTFRDDSPYSYKVIGKLCPLWDFYQYLEPSHKHPGPIIRFIDYKSKEEPSKWALKAEKEFNKAKDSYRKGECSRKELVLPEEMYFREIRRDFRYYPNLLTLLLYLYNEYHTTKIGKKRRIRKVLSNPQIILRAPFLKYWSDFKDCGYDLFNIFSNLLMNIGVEYRNQLHIETETGNKIYLVKTITERIFYEVELNFQFSFETLGPSNFIKENGIENYKKLMETRNRYRTSLVSIQQDWLEKKRKELDFYEQECKSFEQQWPSSHVMRKS